METSRLADRAAHTPERQARIDNASSAAAALRQAIAVQAELKQELRGVATALDVLRRSDAAANAAWKERENARLDRCRDAVRRLRAERVLAAGLTVEVAAQLLWAITSQRVWDDLVMDQGWSTARYRRHLTRAAESMLLTSVSP